MRHLFPLLTLLALACDTTSVGAQDALRLTNQRLTHGLWGAERASNKYVPGGVCYLSFDIENIAIAPDGKVRYRMELTVTNDKGERLFKQKPQDEEVIASLGGKSLPAFAYLDVGGKAPPGTYTLTVTVTDRASNASASLNQKVELLPTTFALVRPQVTLAGNVPTSPIAGLGQDMFLDFQVVGFARNKETGQPDVHLEMRILDETNKPTLEKPFVGDIKQDVPRDVDSLPIHYLLKLNRTGKFLCQIKGEDRIAGKTTELSFPLVVVAPLSK
jgi:hypothetical protein